MTAISHDRLHRILQLAFGSPYEGEREKAVTLFLSLLERSELTLHQLDHSFALGDGVTELRKRARLPVSHVLCVKSREEAILYGHLMQRLVGTHVIPQMAEVTDGYEVTCLVTGEAYDLAERAFAEVRGTLPRYLAAAQQQALSEYHARRKLLFEEAIQRLAGVNVAE